jgi:hypothetical protein
VVCRWQVPEWIRCAYACLASAAVESNQSLQTPLWLAGSEFVVQSYTQKDYMNDVV